MAHAQGVAPLNVRIGAAAPVMGFGFVNGGQQWGGPGMMAPGLGFQGFQGFQGLQGNQIAY